MEQSAADSTVVLAPRAGRRGDPCRGGFSAPDFLDPTAGRDVPRDLLGKRRLGKGRLRKEAVTDAKQRPGFPLRRRRRAEGSQLFRRRVFCSLVFSAYPPV